MTTAAEFLGFIGLLFAAVLLATLLVFGTWGFIERISKGELDKKERMLLVSGLLFTAIALFGTVYNLVLVQ